ncbi:MAG: fumarate hydratase [Deferribacteraceae bacterium]|jgi:fumarate hydratase class I|nr:fumarate hydratase [Deferribacteraceae bacterium]
MANDYKDLSGRVEELIRLSSTDLSVSWEGAIRNALNNESVGSSAQIALTAILENIGLARQNSYPICQDTGFLNIYVDYPAGGRESDYTEAIKEGVRQATAKQYLRPNAVNSLTGKNSENNIGLGAPNITFHQWDSPDTRIRILQKGGGCENCSAQYRLPDTLLGAGRDLKGIRKVVIDAALKAQGQGCAPGVFGVAVGGDRASCAKLAKEQLFRKFAERSQNPELAKLEVQLLDDINSLGIGPMGFGGKTTALEVFTTVQDRHPATFYVSVAYGCWAYRNRSLTIKGEEVIYE